MVRSLLVAVGASIVAVSTLVLWPLLPGRGPSADDRRIADLQRLTHAIEVYRVQHNVLPATLVKLPPDPAAPIHTFDPITNRPVRLPSARPSRLRAVRPLRRGRAR